MKRKIDPQPAKKSYFFGQGFLDIGRAIRQSWAQNAATARRYYSNYRECGMLSFKGVFNLFRALSVVTFGTLFFAAISAMMLCVVSVIFVMVYLVFGLVWLFDRMYQIRHKIFSSCTLCKTKFRIPIYICPGCGAKHTNLVPGSYGIFKRTCLCGEKLPTTFFNGRKKLRGICPECYRRGRRTKINDRESRPLCVPVVGGRSVGKTAFITAFSREFLETVAPAKGLGVEIYSEEKKLIYMDIQDDYRTGSTRMTARPTDVNQASSVAFSFFVKHPKLKPERLVHIYDIAGEVFTDNNENEVQQQYEYCHGIILMIDPFSIDNVRNEFGELLAPEDVAGIGRADIKGVINVFLAKLRQVTGLSDEKMAKVPLAVVIGKIDSAGLEQDIGDRAVRKRMTAEPERFTDYYDTMDYLCRQFLKANDMAAFLNSVTIHFKYNRFFACSAIGHTRDKGAYRPQGVLAPVEWICQRADKDLFDLWTDHKFNKSPMDSPKE